MLKTIGATNKNFSKGTISFKHYIWDQINSGLITKIQVINNETGEESPEIDAKLIADVASEPFNGADYVVAPFRFPEFVTQDGAAELLGVLACRLAELHHFEALLPHHKVGREYMYRRDAVTTFLFSPLGQTWTRNVKSKKRF